MTDSETQGTRAIPAFPGFPDFRANVTFVPNQFFTVVVPHSSRGCVRIVGYMIRKILGWVDTEGNPTREQWQFTYRELITKAGVSREAIAAALAEAVRRRFIRCVRAPRPDRSGESAQSGVYELRWDEDGPYTHKPDEFQGFSLAEATVVENRENGQTVARARVTRRNIPNAFFDYLLPREPLSVIRTVGALLFYSIQWGKGGERKVPVSLSVSRLSHLTWMSRQHVHGALWQAIERGYLELHREGIFDPQAGVGSAAATYRIRWVEGLSPAEWQAQLQNAVPPIQTEGLASMAASCTPPTGCADRSEKVNGDRSKKVNGDRSKKVNGIDLESRVFSFKQPGVNPRLCRDRGGHG